MNNVNTTLYCTLSMLQGDLSCSSSVAKPSITGHELDGLPLAVQVSALSVAQDVVKEKFLF